MGEGTVGEGTVGEGTVGEGGLSLRPVKLPPRNGPALKLGGVDHDPGTAAVTVSLSGRA